MLVRDGESENELGTQRSHDACCSWQSWGMAPSSEERMRNIA